MLQSIRLYAIGLTLLLSTLIMASPAASQAGENARRFLPSADARVQDNTPTTNYGSATVLRVRSTAPAYRSYLRFAVTGLTGPVRYAGLRLFVADGGKAGGSIYAVSNNYRNQTTPWAETELTWQNAPTIIGAPLSTLGPVTANKWVEFDVTPAVRKDGVFSFAITSQSQSAAYYNSKEARANQPVLVVEFANGPKTTAPLTPTPVPGKDAVLVGAGDIATCDHLGDEITANLLDHIPGTVFTAGDNAYPDGTAANFAKCYAPSWGRYRARTRPAPGNHDYHTAGAKAYFAYFGAAAGDPSKGYYSYDLGAWHIVVINSNCPEVGGCYAGSPQERWLRADLAAHPAFCTLAYWHHPRFSSGTTHGSSQSMGDIWQALYAAGADVVINGHEHNYERFSPQNPQGKADPAQGIREFVVGTGGDSLYAFGPRLPNSEVINGETYGVLKLTLHPTSYDWEFVAEPGKAFKDAGHEACTSLDQPRPMPTASQ